MSCRSTDSNRITFNNAGTFYWQAVHSGDANINGAASVCTSQTLVVNPNTTSMSTAQNLLSNDDASLSGDDQHRHRDDHVQPVQPDRFHLLRSAGPHTDAQRRRHRRLLHNQHHVPWATDGGTWRWQVTYRDDANNQGSSSACGVE